MGLPCLLRSLFLLRKLSNVPRHQADRAGFPAFLVSMFLSRLADQVLLFLVPLVVFRLTGDIAWSGIAFTAETLPRFLAFPICGVLCDRRDPVQLLKLSQRCRALAGLAAAAASGMPGGQVGALIALSAVCGVLTTQGVMAREVLLPTIAPHWRFEKVLALTQAADQTGAVLGPVVAAVLLGWWPWGGVVGAAAAVFVLADGALAVWHRLGRPGRVEHSGAPIAWQASIRTAFGQVLGIQGLLRLVLLAAGVNLIVGVTQASSVALVTGVHTQTVAYFAGLQTAGALVTVLILLAIARAAPQIRFMGPLAFSMIGFGGVLTATSTHPTGYAAGYLLIVGFDKMFSIYIRSSRQRIIPPQDYGKTTGIIVLLNNLTQPLSGLLVGLPATWIGTQTLILLLTGIMGVLGLAGLAGLAGPAGLRGLAASRRRDHP